MRLTAWIIALMEAQRGAMLPWLPVALGLGVAGYFSLCVEPAPGILWAAAIFAALLVAAALRWPSVFRPFVLAVAALLAGVALAGARGHLVGGQVLEARFYGAIEGRVVAIDRSNSNALRLTLAELRLEDIPPEATPRRIRISLFVDPSGPPPEAGARVMLTGHLSPPGGPAEPGGFDFQRHAWFQSIGGIGYTRHPVMLLAPRPAGAEAITHLRLRWSAAIQAAIPGQPGAFAAAVTTGDRAGLSPETLDAMRHSNIAHLLAISGLHMGLLTGFIFGALRLGFAAIPALALRFPTKKWAAIGALAVASLYLMLSGGNVATERAFIQVAVMLVAVLLDRRAITLRSVAIAALIVLFHRPETLLSPGFQMSFAATAALVAVFTGLRDATWLRARPAWQKWAFGLVTSSLVAGAATAPFAAAQFNIYAAYGLAANLIAVPIMGSVVVPAAVAAALLAPFGLAGPALWLMGQGLAIILTVAEAVSGWPGAVRGIVTPQDGVMAAIVLGGLWLVIWRGRARWAGAVPILAAMALWPLSDRPDLLISATGGIVGVETTQGRALSRERGDGFVASIWLENDGDRGDQPEAAARGAWQASGAGQIVAWQGLSLWHGTGRAAGREAAAACAAHDIVVTNQRQDSGASQVPALLSLARDTQSEDEAPPCLMLTPEQLTDTGALAITGDGTVTTAHGVQGDRLWSSSAVRQARGFAQ